MEPASIDWTPMPLWSDVIRRRERAKRLVRWSVPEQLTPGTSALFLVTSDVVQDKVKATFEATGLRRPQLIESNLSSEQEAALREMFAG